MEVDYQRALELALSQRNVEFERKVEIPIVYEGVIVTRRRGGLRVAGNQQRRHSAQPKAALPVRRG